jgi:tetratricopeptide (TPR) repeat protein
MFWFVQAKHREGMGWLDRALGAASGAPAELRAAGLFGNGFLLAHDTDDWAAAARVFDEGIAAVSPGGDAPDSTAPAILGYLLCLRGECDVFVGDPGSAVVRTQQGLDIISRYPDRCGQGIALWNVGYALLAAGEVDRAIATFERIVEPGGGHQVVNQIVAYQTLGEIWEKRNALGRARTLFEAALRLRRELGAVRLGAVHGSLPTGLLAVARLAGAQGDRETVSKLVHEALPLAEQMHDEATLAALRALLAQAAESHGDVRRSLAGKFSPGSHGGAGVWHVEWNGVSAHIPDAKGLWHLRELLARPGQPLSAVSLIGVHSEAPLPLSDAGPQLDREALRQYRKRLADLDEDRALAEARHDTAREATLAAEREALLAELARATGLGGRSRQAGSSVERARLNVTRTIRHALKQLADVAPGLAVHLDETITTGTSCCYQPRVPIAWTL